MTELGFLLLATICAALTLNALAPIRRSGMWSFPSFIAAWLLTELAVQALAIQALALALLVPSGALQTLPGRVATALTLGSWLGMVVLLQRSARAGRVLEASLREALPAHGVELLDVPRPPLRLLNPLSKRDREVVIHKNLRYKDGVGRFHLLDVYASKRPRANAPVLLQVHGGGWVVGHKAQQAVPLMLHMAKQGWVCVSANYRLSPSAVFPEHLHDIKAALAWIRANVARYGGDPDYVAITGGSAGGHIATLMALTPNLPELQPDCPDVDTGLRACVPFYGVYDFTDRNKTWPHAGFGRFLERTVLKKRRELDPDAFEQASPMSRVGRHAPPFFVVHGIPDNIVPVADARAFVSLLRAQSQEPVAYAELPGAHHAFDITHSVRTAHAIHAVARFLCSIHARDRARAAQRTSADSLNQALRTA